jgi:hypothetical protein
MTRLFNLPAHRSVLYRDPLTAVLGLTLFLILSGCAGLQLNQFNRHAARGDHQWIAAQVVACHQASHTCGELHLIKGNACLQLAESSSQPAAHLACAVDHLKQGLSLKPSWPEADRRLDHQEQLCRALDHLQHLQTGAAAEQTLEQLVEAAQRLYQLAPGSAAAVYYLSSARLDQMRPLLQEINPATRVVVCQRLKRTATEVLLVMEIARGQVPPGWHRFSDRYERLAFELGMAMQTAGCR